MGYFLHHSDVLRDHVVGGVKLVGVRFPELVAFTLTLVEELGRGAVERNGDLRPGLVAGPTMASITNFERLDRS